MSASERPHPQHDTHHRSHSITIGSWLLAAILAAASLIAVPGVAGAAQGGSSASTGSAPEGGSVPNGRAGLTRAPALHRRSAPKASAGLWKAASPQRARALAGARLNFRSGDVSALSLNRADMRAALAKAPKEFTRAASRRPLVLSLPFPGGGTRRFAVQESPVMTPSLAKRHPEIKAYSGSSLGKKPATVRISMTPLGFSASVRGVQGQWYVERAEHLDEDVYVSYRSKDLVNTHGDFMTGGVIASPDVDAARDPANLSPDITSALQAPPIGTTLRTYRIAILSDPSFASYWGGAANVVAAKALIATRLSQIYEAEMSIRILLSSNTDSLGLNTNPQALNAGAACGQDPCFASSSDMTNCTWTRNGIIMGLLAGADTFDIGHYITGTNYGGVAGIGVVGKSTKYQGCTGITAPAGDELVVQTMAHEVGHQFGADHTYNGTASSCTTDQYQPNQAVEPGSGNTIMAYTGICGNDNTQSRSDPFFSQRTRDYIHDYVSVPVANASETQAVSLVGFDSTDSFRLRFNGNDSALITRGTNYSAAGIKAAIEGISGWPAGGTVSVTQLWATSGEVTDSGFRFTFGGTLAATSPGKITPVDVTGATATSNILFVGGPVMTGGVVTATGNNPPTVSTPASYTIPYRTPFSLTASGSDPDGETITYLWEQNDSSGNAIGLRTATKNDGPLFRVFGTQASGAGYVGTQSPATGYNALSTNPTRVFPDMPQILANNTNAEAACPTSGTASVIVECFSEYLPQAGYAGPMNFRVTVRDGHAGADGIASADTTVNLASGTGPFLVTAPNTAVTYGGNTSQTVTWNIAGTASAPISTANVKISLSTDGGSTFPHVLAASTPNDGTQSVSLPNIGTTQARIKVEAVGNIFFDVSNANFTIQAAALQDQAITFDPIADRVYGDTPTSFAVSPTASSGLPVTITASGGACTRTGLTVTIHQAGTCNITASQPGDLTWAAAPNVIRSFQVQQRPTTISFTMKPKKKLKNGKTLKLNATVSGGGIIPAGTVTFYLDDTTPIVSAPLPSNGKLAVKPPLTTTAGKHKVKAVFTPTSANYAVGTSSSKNLTVKG
jgi:hypothetical protein